MQGDGRSARNRELAPAFETLFGCPRLLGAGAGATAQACHGAGNERRLPRHHGIAAAESARGHILQLDYDEAASRGPALRVLVLPHGDELSGGSPPFDGARYAYEFLRGVGRL